MHARKIARELIYLFDTKFLLVCFGSTLYIYKTYVMYERKASSVKTVQN